ncbi:UNVERIFIED_CONTAM: hypothetical protein Sangu_2879100 [Sesamum angustifolium]|uniref:Uncharacterized protein n=1 Tax=Sesamum angustifolium TaxID=2727405 RepID=A0AAW2INM3_9LAMI
MAWQPSDGGGSMYHPSDAEAWRFLTGHIPNLQQSSIMDWVCAWMGSHYMDSNTNDKKACYFDYHIQFLPHDHPYRRNNKAFTKYRVERKVECSRLTGDEIHDWVTEFSPTVKVPLTLSPSYDSEHKWMKKSIL